MAKKKLKKIEKRKRDWLNPLNSHDSGHISIFTEYAVNENEVGFTADLDISDCSRKVCLDFSIFWSSKKELERIYKARKRKIEIICNHLKELEEQMDKYYEHVINKDK